MNQYPLNIEAFALEAIIGVISAIFAVGGFHAQIPQIAIPCAVVAIACWGLVIHSIYMVFRSRRARKKQYKS
ncbi:hypothetical protein KIH87_05970 [Paraneptunicella aestuarii]|uniref:hypothetical protein n=1 Tax=Paraneptunicella aestuarii TaxID=2831148 RepID=UPI001E3718D7|nr:hypothetical protein [Paraneptunicella aestuarii]UAA39898.1 hypothetical protein KIH87_05970 [Paraneptunicella aestuarii]